MNFGTTSVFTEPRIFIKTGHGALKTFTQSNSEWKQIHLIDTYPSLFKRLRATYNKQTTTKRIPQTTPQNLRTSTFPVTFLNKTEIQSFNQTFIDVTLNQDLGTNPDIKHSIHLVCHGDPFLRCWAPAAHLDVIQSCENSAFLKLRIQNHRTTVRILANVLPSCSKAVVGRQQHSVVLINHLLPYTMTSTYCFLSLPTRPLSPEVSAYL